MQKWKRKSEKEEYTNPQIFKLKRSNNIAVIERIIWCILYYSRHFCNISKFYRRFSFMGLERQKMKNITIALPEIYVQNIEKFRK